MAQHPGHPGTAFLPAASQALRSRASRRSAVDPRPASPCCCRFSGKQQSAGSAVRDGFAAAWFASSSADTRPRIEMYDTVALGAAAAYQRALAEGARMVVGPLNKEEITAVIASQPAGLPVPTLALNSAASTPGMAAPAFLYHSRSTPSRKRAPSRDGSWTMAGWWRRAVPRRHVGQRVHDAFGAGIGSSRQRHADVVVVLRRRRQGFCRPLRRAGPLRRCGRSQHNPNQPLPRAMRRASRRRSTVAFVAATPQAARAPSAVAVSDDV